MIIFIINYLLTKCRQKSRLKKTKLLSFPTAQEKKIWHPKIFSVQSCITKEGILQLRTWNQSMLGSNNEWNDYLIIKNHFQLILFHWINGSTNHCSSRILKMRMPIDFLIITTHRKAGSASVKHYQGTVNSLSKFNIDFQLQFFIYLCICRLLSLFHLTGLSH